MSSPFFRVLQMLTRFLLAVAWVALTIAATSLLFFGNFVVAWQAFELLGYEITPLADVPLLGPFAMAAGVGEAPLVSLYAAGLTSAMAVVVVSALKFGNDALTLFFDYRQARLAGTPDSATLIRVWETGVAFLLLSALAATVAGYDVWLFGLRLEALVTGIDDMKETISWLPEPVSRLGGYMAQFSAHARWGYLAVIFGVAFATEKSFQRASERWLVLGQTVDAWILGLAIQSGAANGPVATSTGYSLGGPEPVDVTPAAAPIASGDVAEPLPDPGVNPPPAQPAPAPPVRGPVELGSTPPPPRGPVVHVICGPGVTRDVSIQEVEKHSEQYVRDGSGRAWFLRTYADELNGDLRQPEDRENKEEHAHV